MIGPALKGELTARRSRYNTAFARARASGAHLDAEAFACHVRDAIDPVATAVAEVAPSQVGAVVETLYDLSLDLLARGLLGPQAKSSVLSKHWAPLLSAGAAHLTSAPRPIAAAIGNALLALHAVRADAPALWATRMATLAPLVLDGASWRSLGRIAAWCCGAARLRATALHAARHGAAEGVAMALGVPGLPPVALAEVIDVLETNRWRSAERAVRGDAVELRLHRVGGFVGFGGPFVTPPVATSDGARIWARDRSATWELHADVYGHEWLRAPDPPPVTGTTAPFRLGTDGAVEHGDLHRTFVQLAAPSSVAATADGIAVTLPHSHHLYLVGAA